ncbi:MAG: hypothetical protein Q9220_005842 [cf. Caloplaca sp. 1 TL-2023]
MGTGYAIPASSNGANHFYADTRRHTAQRGSVENINKLGMNVGLTDKQIPNGQHPYSQSHVHTHQDTNHESEAEHEGLDSASHLPPSRSISKRLGSTRPQGMQRRISVGLPTHLRLEGKGYGLPSARKAKFAAPLDPKRRNWITWTELLSSILLSLPYVSVNIFNDHIVPKPQRGNPVSGSQPTETLDEFPVRPNSEWRQASSLFTTLAITAATLIISGLVGKARQIQATTDQHHPSANRNKSQSPWANGTIFQWARGVSARLSSVALPLFAVSCLGGQRVALLMLILIFSGIITVGESVATLTDVKGWKQLSIYRRWTLIFLVAQAVFDFTFPEHPSGQAVVAAGYLAISFSVLALPPPFPTIISDATPRNQSGKPATASVVLSSGIETPTAPEVSSLKKSTASPLISSSNDINTTLEAGVFSVLLSILAYVFSNLSEGTFSLQSCCWFLLTVCLLAMSLLMAQPQSLQENKGLGLLFGLITSSAASSVFRHSATRLLAGQSLLTVLAFLAVQIDVPILLALSSQADQRNDSRHQNPVSTVHNDDYSRFTQYLLMAFHKWPLLHSILIEKDSRRIFYFMCLNFAFMLIQTFYGVATGSLGLLSDSVHMFFDCLALIVGLCAAVMSKWPPSTRFPYGYSKIDTLAGFANGIFLMLISIEIVYEAVERLAEGSEMQRIGELLTVSTLGLAVNLVGVTAFGHAHHGHSHHGESGHGHSHHDHSHHDHSHHNHDHDHLHNDHSHHDHSHHNHSHHDHPHHDHINGEHDRPYEENGVERLSHESNDRSISVNQPAANHEQSHRPEANGYLHASPIPSPYSSVPATPSKPLHTHSPTHKSSSHHQHHHHGHGNENMHGIYLHVLADTLGSVAVVGSTLLIHFYGWSGFDPLASCLIAILIFASAIPLVKSSARTLLLTIPENTEFDLREALAGVSALRGVTGYAAPKFWLEEGDERKVLGVIHITAARGADMEDLKERAVTYLRSKRMDILVQVEREGTSRCWCRAKAG